MGLFACGKRICGRCMKSPAVAGRRYCVVCEPRVRKEMEESGYLSLAGGVSREDAEDVAEERVRPDGSVRAAER